MFEYQVTASIVLYNPTTIVWKTIESFLEIRILKTHLYLVDNSPTNKFENENSLFLTNANIKYIFNNKNLGYGAAHNIAIRDAITKSEYHLVLNPDVYFEPGVIENIYAFASADKNIGQLMPKVLYPDGELQYTCKLVPSPLQIMCRMLPSFMFKTYRQHFEMRFSGYNKIMIVPYLSGCFMFLNCSAVKQVGLFDERFFMYPEDIDLTRRMFLKYKTVYYPNVHIHHVHAKASYKIFKLFIIHIINMCKYFTKWGWFCDVKRKKINTEVISQFV